MSGALLHVVLLQLEPGMVSIIAYTTSYGSGSNCFWNSQEWVCSEKKCIVNGIHPI